MKASNPGKRVASAGSGGGGSAGGDPAPDTHSIRSPQRPPIGDPLPTVTVYVVNGVGYIEAAGANQCMVPMISVFGKVFRTAALAPADPTAILDSCVQATIDPMGFYYHFISGKGNMVSDAQGGYSMANYLVTWALFSDKPSTWVQCTDGYVQFIGV